MAKWERYVDMVHLAYRKSETSIGGASKPPLDPLAPKPQLGWQFHGASSRWNNGFISLILPGHPEPFKI